MLPDFANVRGLEKLSINELRKMAKDHLGISGEDAQSLAKVDLVARLSDAGNQNKKLREEINRLSIAFKPSFYLMNIVSRTDIDLEKEVEPIIERVQDQVEEINKSIDKSRNRTPSPTNVQLLNVRRERHSLLEFQFSWRRAHWYWAPDPVKFTHIYELRLGYALLDFRALRALLICQNVNERKIIEQAIGVIAPVDFTTTVLTGEILDQIGEFERVKRAKYLHTQPTEEDPLEIAFADEELSSKPVAQHQEEDPYSLRKESFYRVPILGVEESGLGATTDTGKLWLPRVTEVETVRQYGLALLDKVTTTVDQLAEDGRYTQVIRSMGLEDIEAIREIKPVFVRKAVLNLVTTLANMLITKENERTFSFSDEFLIKAVPKYLLPPTLFIADDDIGITSIWMNSKGNSLLKPYRKGTGEIGLKEHPRGKSLDLNELLHPITGNRISVDNDFIYSLKIIPSDLLHGILLDAMQALSLRLDELEGIRNLPFVITNNRILLDVELAFNRDTSVDIDPREVNEYVDFMQTSIPTNRRDNLLGQLTSFGELCKNQSHNNCHACLDEQRFICLRSLVARYANNPELGVHQGIELSDGQGELTINGDIARYFSFAKLAKSGGQLTARNSNGAILLSQVLMQIEKQTFDIVMIISPSPLAEDIRNNLRLLCQVFNKRLLFLDDLILPRMLIDFEDQAAFDSINLGEIYSASRKKLD